MADPIPSEILPSPAEGPAAALDVQHAQADLLTPANLKKIADQSGSTLGALVRRYIKLAFGPGKLSFNDFLWLRLFERETSDAGPLEAFVGRRRNRDICVAVNYRHDLYGLLTDKVASQSYLAAYGLPTIPTKACYLPGLATGAANVLPDRAALTAFLANPDVYPLFGKPQEGIQSLGTIGMRSVDPASGMIAKTAGGDVSIASMVDEIVANYGAGYIFQPLLRPHSEILRLCGDKISCVRLVTALTEDGPRILGGCWKIPAGLNAADNFWRAGNMLAQIDLDSGRILRAFSGAGLDFRERSAHPDTGVELPGFQHPQWDEMKKLALAGATLMRHVPLIGWDIACSENGPVIVEPNEAPDLSLVQLANRKGILTPDFKAFMDFQAGNAAAFLKRIKTDIAKI